MTTIEKGRLARKLSGWFFSKKVFPYWCIILMDTVIVFAACVFSFWVSKRTVVMMENQTYVLCTAAMYALLSWVGARIFRTYSGVVRYSSFVDLMKVGQANLLSMALAIGVSLLFKHFGVAALSALTVIETIAGFLVAMLLQWAMRVTVKSVFDIANADALAMPVLIYGALTGGVGVAKGIRAQNPAKFELRGFITHEHKIKDMRLMGVPVYTLEQDIAAIVKKEGIRGVIVSPLRVEEFRRNQKIQDILIGEGCKIYMGQEAREASVKNGELSPEDIEGLQIKEVSVEDLLPRQQIRVDMKSVGEQLAG